MRGHNHLTTRTAKRVPTLTDAPRRAPIDLPPPPRIPCKKEVARRGASGD
ncbi:hypothetical protein [uncultured Duncaniella sp.]|nr:hypothetical protein [uncultured Duncaniella sp.]